MADANLFIRRGIVIAVILLLAASGCAAGNAARDKEKGKTDALARLEKVEVRDNDASTTVAIITDRPVTYTSVRLTDPPKMVVDLAGVELGAVTETIKAYKGPVNYITPSKVAYARRVARIEIGLSRAAHSRTVQKEKEGEIDIIFEKVKDEAPAEPAKAAAPPSPPEKVEVAEVAAENKPAGPKRVVTEAAKPPAPVAPAKPEAKAAPKPPEAKIPDARSVQQITYAPGRGGYVINIEGDGRFGQPGAFMLGKDRLVLDMPGMSAPRDKLAIEVGGRCLKRIRMARHEAPQKKVRVVLDLGCPVDYDIKAGEGRTLTVAVAPAGKLVKAAAAKPEAAPRPEAAAKTAPAKPEKTAKAAAAKPAPAAAAAPKKEAAVTQKAENIYISKADGKAILSSTPIEPAPAAKGAAEAKSFVETNTKIYTGGRISFDVQDAELDKVIKLLADVAGLNLILDPADVKGKVTLKLDNVPWDQALDILLKIYNLDKTIEGNVMRVAAKTKMDEEKRSELLQIAEQKKLQEQAQELYTKTFKVNYTTAADLEPKIKKVLSPRGDATANPRTNELIVTDVKDSLEKAGQLISILDKEVNQIMIEARIVTVKVGYSQSLGMSWGLTRQTANGKANFALASGTNSALSFTDSDQHFKLTLPADLKTALPGMVGGLTWLNIAKDVHLDLTIQALESIEKAQVLSAPKVVTLENQAAQITSGETLYVQTTSAAGTKPEPLNANLSLTVTPHVTGDNFIMMDVTATKNSPLTPPPGSTAAIDTNSVTTKVMVKDGDTIVLGGIYVKDKDKADTQVPWVGRIPLLGWLFKERSDKDTTSELLIFITPKLMKQSQQV